MDINSIAHHPSGRTHGVSAIIIKSTVEHYELPSFESDYLQATIEAKTGIVQLHCLQYTVPLNIFFLKTVLTTSSEAWEEDSSQATTLMPSTIGKLNHHYKR